MILRLGLCARAISENGISISCTAETWLFCATDCTAQLLCWGCRRLVVVAARL